MFRFLRIDGEVDMYRHSIQNEKVNDLANDIQHIHKNLWRQEFMKLFYKYIFQLAPVQNTQPSADGSEDFQTIIQKIMKGSSLFQLSINLVR